MANNVIILGKSGSGKSSSIKTLNPKETVIINVLRKKLPFKGSQSLYNADNKNLFNVDDYTQVISLLQ
jgi:predicted AAA+ superfamily ATPase